ncbi:MAG: YncE family protein [Nitrospirae bacterium]|nr:YncE family protein [Candidatus Manganitrophaceae bacterium]
MTSRNNLLKSSIVLSLFVLAALAGCSGQSGPPAGLSKTGAPPGVEARIFVGNTNGKVSVIEQGSDGNPIAETIDLFSSVGDMASSTRNHIFVNMGSTNQTAALDPVGATAVFKKFIAVGQRPVHIYRESPDGTRIWVLNDADPSTGIDTVTSACNTAQAGSVSVIQNHDEGGDETGNAGEVLKTICIGKGHHKAAFSYPTSAAPTVPLRAFVSSIKEGTISVIDNDPASPTYLTVIGTIDLCDSAGEAAQGKPACDSNPATSNNAGPHGMFFSPVSGKLYNNNESYGTENVIDPATLAIEATVNIGPASATHITPDARFIVVRGTDTQSDPARITGNLAVINVADNSVTITNLPDVSPGDLAFTSDGAKLYVASAASGNTAQKASQKSNVVQVFDTTALPTLTLIKEIGIGSTTAGRVIGLQEHDGTAEHLFATNRTDGTVSVIDAKTDTAINTVQVGGTPTSLLVFSMEGDLSH